jgi:flavin reductase (DIM6/NTAB) family NADH-FMN oxidoreductase RutF
MKASTTGFSREQGRELLTSAIVPRPIGWISTLSGEEENVPNIAPFSTLAPVCNEPPQLSFCCNRDETGRLKTTAKNIHHSREFVVNLVGSHFLDKVCRSAESELEGSNKFCTLAIKTQPCAIVKAPRVKGANASIECRLARIVRFGRSPFITEMFIGEIVYVHISEAWRGRMRKGGVRQRDILGALELDQYLVNAILRRYEQSDRVDV